MMTDRIELHDYRDRFRGLPQRGQFWCVPATVASMLTYQGIDVSQEDLILAYCERFRKDGPLSRLDGSSVPLDSLTQEQVIEAARDARLVHANFKHFGEIASAVSDLGAKRLGLRFVDDIDNTALVGLVRDGLKAGSPVAVSAQSGPATYHVCVALAADGNSLRCYDSAPDREVVLRAENTVFSRDLLFLEPILS